ncbi:MAG: hypothetical protein KF845_03665 [Cyclobacteriaceae bacterium]|nr:hypothetical protein [Cyclobacteriaceae bacterium]
MTDIVKHIKPLSLLVVLGFSALFLSNCSDRENQTKTPCLPTQFPFEEEDGVIDATYDLRNRLAGVTYTFNDDADFTFTSIRSFNSDNEIVQVNFYVNGSIAADFIKVTHAKDTIKEEHYRSGSAAENLQSYRYYYLNSSGKVTSFSEREHSNSFAKGDSTVYTYTGNNVTLVRLYNELNELEESYEITYDNNTNPYNEVNFSGDEYLFSPLNLSENNPVSIKHVESGDITTFSYTFAGNGFLLTRKSSAVAEAGEFKYSCTVE